MERDGTGLDGEAHQGEQDAHGGHRGTGRRAQRRLGRCGGIRWRRRRVSLKALDEPRASGKVHKVSATLQNGLTQEQAKKVAKAVRDEGPKGVKVQVQGDEVRVSSKKRDDLQRVIAVLKEQDLDFALQFLNYR